MSTKKSSLTYEPVSAWDSYATTTRRRQVNALAQRYIEFLSACKTERETIAYVQKRLAEAGFGEDFRKASVMRSLHGKCLFAVRKGRSTLASGVRLIAAHADSPRLDFKQRPLVEQACVVQGKTHYYGGIRKYQWLARPLALHGVVILENGKSVPVCIGEKPGDPVFTIADLLPHLAQKQSGQKVSEAFEGEKLNVVLGHSPALASAAKKEAEILKKLHHPNIIQYLNSFVGSTKKDFRIVLEYADAKDSDIVIITSGIARKPGQTRIELTQTNVNIIKEITPQIVKAAPNAIYIIVSNPVDVLTYVFTRISGLPENQIIGSGTVLDTARLRYGLSEHFHVAQKNIHAYVYGEHGDSSFVPWSNADIASVNLDDYYAAMADKVGIEKLDKDAMEEYVHKSGGQVIAKKGATFYAVSVAVCELCNLILAASDSVATVSSMMHGEYGIEDVCLSTLTLVGPNGVQGRIPMHLTEEEVAKLQASAKVLKDVIAQIEI